ncbi:MAG: rRNA maturation RNase YbeY [Flavobacteriales bacterium]|nr:rRNA maturation RNase YbeY [Flavobacteriales bacterium]
MGASPIRFVPLDIDFALRDEAHIAHWLTRVAEGEDFFIGRLTYQFCSDGHLLEINRTHLKHDYYTDIITFDTSRPPVLSGEVFISLDRVRANAADMGKDVQVELYRVMVHGLLHLMGYADASEEDKAQMRSLEDNALRMLH